jgi:hypothetical protein
MKRMTILLALFVAGWSDAHAAPASTNPAPTNRILMIDPSSMRIATGKATAIIGTATTNGKGGRTRHIDATATPADINRGTLKLWFTAGNRKMIFEPAYHFAGKGTAAVSPQTAGTNNTSNLQRRLPVSHREALEAAAKHL